MSKKSRSLTVAAAAFGLAATARAQVGPVPAATAIGTTGLCVVPGWEYAPRWSLPNNGYNSPSMEACAADCAEDPVCTGATYIEFNTPDGQKNCWFKGWGTGPVATPCEPDPSTTGDKTFNAVITPNGGDCASITYNGDAPLNCQVEAEEFPDGGDAVTTAGAPGAATDAVTPAGAAPAGVTMTDVTALTAVGFQGYPGVDYGPTQPVPPMTPITDLLGGSVEVDAVACAEMCAATPECNSASYYGDNPMPAWPGGKNCYLKTLEGCMLPADTEAKTDATIFMIGGPECEGAPLTAAAPVAMPPGLPLAPAAAPPVLPGAFAPVAPVGTQGTRDFGMPVAAPPLGSPDPLGGTVAAAPATTGLAPATGGATAETGTDPGAVTTTSKAAGISGVLATVFAAALAAAVFA